MDAHRIIPIDGKNPYADHPGFEAGGCELRYTVTPSTSVSSYGFGCEATGGHCVPGAYCQSRRDVTFVEQQIRAWTHAPLT